MVILHRTAGFVNYYDQCKIQPIQKRSEDVTSSKLDKFAYLLLAIR